MERGREGREGEGQKKREKEKERGGRRGGEEGSRERKLKGMAWLPTVEDLS